MEWIKCSDRMPEDGRDVLAWHIEGYPRLVRWEENRNPLFTSPCGNYSRLADGWADISELDVHEPEGSFTHWAGSLYDINNNAPDASCDNEMFIVIEGGKAVFAWWDSVKRSFLDNHDLCIRRYMHPTHWVPLPAPTIE